MLSVLEKASGSFCREIGVILIDVPPLANVEGVSQWANALCMPMQGVLLTCVAFTYVLQALNFKKRDARKEGVLRYALRLRESSAGMPRGNINLLKMGIGASEGLPAVLFRCLRIERGCNSLIHPACGLRRVCISAKCAALSHVRHSAVAHPNHIFK